MYIFFFSFLVYILFVRKTLDDVNKNCSSQSNDLFDFDVPVLQLFTESLINKGLGNVLIFYNNLSQLKIVSHDLNKNFVDLFI